MDAFGALLTLEGTLQDEIGPGLDDLATTASLEELAAEGASSQVIDLFHPFKDGVALRAQSLEWVGHGSVVSHTIQYTSPKKHAPHGALHLRLQIRHTPNNVPPILYDPAQRRYTAIQMNASVPSARRANVDDLPAIKTLWAKCGIDVPEAERRLTEFQVAMDSNENLAGCGALRISGQNGLIHSEGFSQKDQRDWVRAALWPRFQALARNLGLARLWIRDADDFWKANGFAAPTETSLKKWPMELGEPGAGLWCLVLKEESLELISIEKEFELFQQSQKESSDKVLRQARTLKSVAMVILGLAVVAVVVFMARLVTRTPLFRSLFRGR